MPNDIVRELVVRAVQQAFDAWAIEHPSLSGVIDRIELTQQAAESLRNSEAYRAAVEAYHRSRGELDLLNRLLDLAAPAIAGIVGM